MKKLVVTAALATLLAAPAIVTSHAQQAGTQSQRNATVGNEYGNRAPTFGAAQAEGYSAYAEDDVSDQRWNGTVLGRDPDANVRMQMQRDEPADWN
jgi:opacity protein-like surface antigen